MDVLLIANTQTVKVEGLRYEDTGAYINNKTVTATVMNMNGTNVAGETWPLTLDYTTNSNGKYTGALTYALELKVGKKYIVEIVADDGAGSVATWHFVRTAVYRTP